MDFLAPKSYSYTNKIYLCELKVGEFALANLVCVEAGVTAS